MAPNPAVAALLPEMTAWRHDLHRHPELQFDLPRTSAKVAGLLRDFGCDEVVTGVGRSGVVGVIHGKRVGDRVIGLRADMDALPIIEATGLPYASVTVGMMHACGHDGHTAMLLGAAKHLARTRDFAGKVVVIFQPAEEAGGGGLAMVQDGLMERFAIQEVYAMHNQPGLAVGQFASREGAVMAAADEFEIILTGKGGHAAKPHYAVDPMPIAAQIILGLQTITSRILDPAEQAVLSVCTITTDSRIHNVIPQEVVMTGTLRCFSAKVRDVVEERMGRIIEGIAASFGASAVLHYRRGYPATLNAVAQTAIALDAARDVVGAAAVVGDFPALMAAEDFSYMLQARPGAYIFIGNGDSTSVHHPQFDFNDAALPYGASWFVQLAENRLTA